LGIIIYMLLCGFPPFFDTNIKKLFKMIKKGKFGFPSPFWDTISDEAKDLIKKLLVVDAKKRYTASELLKHEWIKGYYFETNDGIDDIPLPLSPDIIEEDDIDNNNNLYHDIGASLQPVISNQNSFVYENASIDNNQFSSKRSDVSNSNESDVSNTNTNITQTTVNRFPLSPTDSVVFHQNALNDKGGVFGTPIMNGINSPIGIEDDDVDDMFDLNKREDVNKKRIKKQRSCSRVKTMASNVAYMVDGTIFQIQKQKINKLKAEIESERMNLMVRTNQLQIEMHTFEENKKEWEIHQKIWMNQHKGLKQLRQDLDDVMNKYLNFQKK